jgi:hypothetical protein
MIHRAGKVLSGIRERPIQVEHNQIDFSFHRRSLTER